LEFSSPKLFAVGRVGSLEKLLHGKKQSGKSRPNWALEIVGKNPNESSTGIFPKKSRCWNSCDPTFICKMSSTVSTCQVVQHLLRAQASTEKATEDGRTPLLIAAGCSTNGASRKGDVHGDVLQLPTSWDFETNFARASFYGPKKPFYWFFYKRSIRDP